MEKGYMQILNILLAQKSLHQLLLEVRKVCLPDKFFFSQSF